MTAATPIDGASRRRSRHEAQALARVAFLERDRRVELNALTSEQLVALIEARLTEHGVTKVVPDANRLAAAYRRAYQVSLLDRAMDAAAEDASRRARDAVLPEGLVDQVEERLKKDPGLPWDDAVASLVHEALEPRHEP